ncbi:hypothetical protein GA0115241_113858 [Streptomyces sp. DpondAA-D4]|nr:hypothetical protein GA0115241_113858 [Streptomyces sp. DpondAA-D4]
MPGQRLRPRLSAGQGTSRHLSVDDRAPLRPDPEPGGRGDRRTAPVAAHGRDRTDLGRTAHPRAHARPCPSFLGDAQPDGHTPPIGRDTAQSPAADTELSARLARHAAETNVNTLVLEQFDADVERLARDFVSRPLPCLIPEIRTAQEGVFQLLEGRQHPSQTRHLYVVAGWLSGLAAHVSLDLGNRSAAATHVRTVVQCAEISEHSPLRAWARSFQSLAAFWAGDYRRAGDLAQAGQSEGRGPGTGTIKARLLSLEARARAAEGDNRSALRVLALAREARGAAGPDELPGVFSFPEAKQWAYAGTTLLAVGGNEQIQQAVGASNRAVELPGRAGRRPLPRRSTGRPSGSGHGLPCRR